MTSGWTFDAARTGPHLIIGHWTSGTDAGLSYLEAEEADDNANHNGLKTPPPPRVDRGQWYEFTDER